MCNEMNIKYRGQQKEDYEVLDIRISGKCYY